MTLHQYLIAKLCVYFILKAKFPVCTVLFYFKMYFKQPYFKPYDYRKKIEL